MEKKPAETTAKKADTAEKEMGPTLNGTSSNGEKADSIRTPDEPADKGYNRDVSIDMKGPSPKKSLYVKGIPIPTTQDELKELFKASDKVSAP